MLYIIHSAVLLATCLIMRSSDSYTAQIYQKVSCHACPSCLHVFTVCLYIQSSWNVWMCSFGIMVSRRSKQTNKHRYTHTWQCSHASVPGALSGSPTTTIIQSFTTQYDHKYAAIFLHVCSESNNANDNKKISSGIGWYYDFIMWTFNFIACSGTT